MSIQNGYIAFVTIAETPDFTRAALKLIGEDSLTDLKMELIEDPKKGVVIPDGKGLRKIRWAAKGKGKRGGSRVIYFYIVKPAEIRFLAIYPKNEKEDLTKTELKELQKKTQ